MKLKALVFLLCAGETLCASTRETEKISKKQAAWNFTKDELYPRIKNGVKCSTTSLALTLVGGTAMCLKYYKGEVEVPEYFETDIKAYLTILVLPFLTGFSIHPTSSKSAIATGAIHSLASVFPRGNPLLSYLYFAGLTAAACAYVKDSYKSKERNQNDLGTKS